MAASQNKNLGQTVQLSHTPEQTTSIIVGTLKMREWKMQEQTVWNAKPRSYWERLKLLR